MATWTKQDIERKIRKVTGRVSENEMSSQELSDRLNKYYQYTFPAEVKLDRNHTYYELLTSVGQPYYTAPTTYTNFEPPATIDSQDMFWYQDPAVFFSLNALPVISSTPFTGDGVTAAFSTTVGSYIYPGTLVVSDNVETFQDTNTTYTTANVIISGSLGGTLTLNYSTGLISPTFLNPPANGQTVYVSYSKFTPGRPGAVLYYNNAFQFFPVPDTAYRFKVKAYAKLPELVLATDRPLQDVWGPCLAYGTARDIFADYGEADSYSEISILYKEQLSYVMNATVENLLNVRSVPTF